MRSRTRLSLLLCTCALVPFLSCTDVGLYKWGIPPYQANKLTVSGTVCSDDPHQRNFPVKILFMIDASLSVRADKNDMNGYRGRAVDEIVSLWGKSPNYHFGIMSFASKARNLIETGFTRDSALLSAAIATIKGSGGLGTESGRDLRAAVSLASSIITGDLLAGDPGQVARTTYVLVLFSGGPPVPAVNRCVCRDKVTEKDNWGKCGWADCDCKVKCPAVISKCETDICTPICTPDCTGDQYCDSTPTGLTVCKDGDPPSGTPTIPPELGYPAGGIPDTYTQHLAASGASATTCTPVTGIDVTSPTLNCVYSATAKTGYNESCEERTLVGLVRDLKDFAKKNGAAQLQLHTTYLPDNGEWTAPGWTQPSVWIPPCGKEANEVRTVRLLSEMAYAADGNFVRFADPDAITFRALDLHTTRDPLVIKELVATNINVIVDTTSQNPNDPDPNQIDTDADGLTDYREEGLKSCASDEDTDGDGVGDAVELRLAFDPLAKEEHIECIDLISSDETGDDPCNAAVSKKWRRYKDKDGDNLNACEERLLGTSDSLMDSDADGLPDKVEFVAGSNYLAVDHLVDSDMDGNANRDEIRAHTDPRSNDSQAALDLAYRYEEVDEGVKPVLSFTQPSTITGVSIKNISAASGTGLGYLKYSPGPPAKLAWKDPDDVQTGGDFGDPVDISRPNGGEGYKLLSCRKSTTAGERCAPDSSDRYLTVLTEGKDSYPPADRVDTVVVSSAMRNCLRFRVRNITLRQTGVHRVLKTPGNNTVKVYFSEAPRNAKDGFGIFRVRDIQLNYRKGPPESRTPREAEITVSDDDFTIRE